LPASVANPVACSAPFDSVPENPNGPASRSDVVVDATHSGSTSMFMSMNS
jgi:hypothetical protein